MNSLQIGTMVQNKKYKNCVGMITQKDLIDNLYWYTINFGGTNNGIFRPKRWLYYEIFANFDTI